MLRKLTLVLLAATLLGTALARPLRAGWGDDPTPTQAPPADQKADAQPAPDDKPVIDKPVIEDKESWSKYSFNLKEADGNDNVTFADLAASRDAST